MVSAPFVVSVVWLLMALANAARARERVVIDLSTTPDKAEEGGPAGEPRDERQWA